MKDGSPLFPSVTRSQSDHFLQQVQQSGKKWVALTNPLGQPQMVLDADGFLRAAFFGFGECDPMPFCHRPIVVTDENVAIGDVLHQLRVDPQTAEDDVVDNDIILVWGKKKRIITGADILGRLLRGIVIQGSTGLTK